MEGGGGGEPQSGGLQLSSATFKAKWPTRRPIALKLLQNMAKSMVYIISYLSCDDFQQGGYLYKPSSGIQWTPEHSWISNRPKKQNSAKADPATFGRVYWQ